MKLLSSGADPKKIKLMEDIHSQAERCRRIVANLLQVARRQEQHIEPIRINELLDRVLQLREYELNTRNIRLVRNFDSSNPTLLADPDKIQQVVLNILNNATDAIQETGRPGMIQVRTRSEDGKVVLEFEDNGTGIREPERVFDPFYTTKEVGKGTGLGLSVCYGIVQEHDGEIRAENRPEGACFIVTLPIGDITAFNHPEHRPRADSVKEAGRKLTGLIVDDEESLLELQISVLSDIGMKAHGTKSGEEAIRFLQENSIDFIVSDVRMPGPVDGVRLYEWVCQNRPNLAKRFAFVSGDVLALHDGQLPSLSKVPTILKPFQFENYRQLIQHLVEN